MRGYRYWEGDTVIVSTKSFDVKGTLAEVRAGLLVLRDAVALDGDVNTPIDGVLLVPGDSIRYVQVP